MSDIITIELTPDPDLPEYPEHDKLEAVVEQSQAIGEFLDVFLPSKNIHFGRPSAFEGGGLNPIHINIQELLAEFFGIDRDKLEMEKEAMLDEIRRLNDRYDQAPNA